ncbi:MAG: hypothetical protein HY741_12975 [Chloroflexi bacterium]|nr:hypothetical protein [Chloroflexota bacterium]
MKELSVASQVMLYVLLAVMGLFAVLLWVWQFMILRGKAFKNPDGSIDDWHAQKTHYGIAFADVFVACPANIIGIVLVFVAPRWGYYLLALVSFWWVWANVMTTATSLRFYNPRLNLPLWLIGYPFGILVGLAYIVWTVIHFDAIYLP